MWSAMWQTSQRKLGYNLGVPKRSALTVLLREFYKHFYNRLAFTYDTVSGVVSRGEWRDWTRAAIDFVRPPRVLEIAFGTGNLLVDLAQAGYHPVGVDLSRHMIEITRNKFKGMKLTARIIRASVSQLPFPPAYFDSIVMTFPAGFVKDEHTMFEISRVLADDGRLVWVDAPYLYPRDSWSRFLNWAFRVTGSSSAPAPGEMRQSTMRLPGEETPDMDLDQLLPLDGWSWNVHRVEMKNGFVHVMVGAKSPPG